jgi:homogentisate 1,2-dioxygenase
MEESIGAKATTELAVMVDTFKPLRLTEACESIDDADYPLSWL